MGTTLTGTTPQDTYDSLIKVTDNGPLSGTAKYLSDGLGNDSKLALSTGNIGIGTTSPSRNLHILGGAGIGTVLKLEAGSGAITYLQLAYNGATNAQSGYISYDSSSNMGLFTNDNEKVRITSAGNVGIGTSSPEAVASSTTLQVNGADHSLVRTGTSAFGGYLATIPIVGVTAISNARNPITGTYNNTGVAASVISLFSENANSYITFSTATANNSNPSERVRVTSNGLTFNGDTAAANALDDYEEGTWTMGLSFGGGTTGITYNGNTGKYTKIGRQVTATGYLALSSKGSSTGIAWLTGLPFALASGDSSFSPATVWFIRVSFANQFEAYGQTGATHLVLGELTEAGTFSSLADSDFQNNTEIMVSITYFV